ncbi:MAG: hypothetical protein UV79_C0007G0009 [candidate division TM6 bacterium GW2011_GWF2_43_17]|nr:MAG: hypothetical protein UV79_C0007G0009 [candidate division TM6 bacterium GW2011_GWF2_43_17]
MSGHSKWKTIKHKKAAADAQRSKLFTKLIKEITVAARSGGGDPVHNAALRALLEKAKKLNMPQDNAMRAIKKGTGELPGVHYESHMYEGYGPAGIAVMVEVLTDNKNRAVAELRSMFTRKGGTLAENGAVSWMFERSGVITARGETDITEDALVEALLEFSIKDLSLDDGNWTVVCDPQEMEAVKSVLECVGMTIEDSEVAFLAQNATSLDENQSQLAYDFLEAVEELDDVQNVYANVE